MLTYDYAQQKLDFVAEVVSALTFQATCILLTSCYFGCAQLFPDIVMIAVAYLYLEVALSCMHAICLPEAAA